MMLLERRVRGFRLVDLVGLGLLVCLILGVYLAKTIAGRERAEIARVERQIAGEKARIRLLQAEVSHLEQPSRIGHLSQAYLGLAPVNIKRETTSEDLVNVARRTPEPAPVVAPPVATPPAVVDEAPIPENLATGEAPQ